jgi:hypothetical protein
MIATEGAATGAAIQATHSAHEGTILTVGLIVWAAGAVFIGVGLAERRGLFRRWASVTFARWASIVAAGLSSGAAAIHFSVIGVHYAEYPPHGVLFAALAWAQAAWAVAYLLRPTAPLAVLAAALNAGVVAVWVVSRTVGLPYGPAPFVAEPVGLLDGLATAFELALIVLLVVLLSGRARSVRLVPGLATAYAGSALAILVVLTSVSLAAGGHEHDPAARGHSHEPATASHDDHASPTIPPDPTIAVSVPSRPAQSAVSPGSSHAAIDRPSPNAATETSATSTQSPKPSSRRRPPRRRPPRRRPALRRRSVPSDSARASTSPDRCSRPTTSTPGRWRCGSSDSPPHRRGTSSASSSIRCWPTVASSSTGRSRSRSRTHRLRRSSAWPTWRRTRTGGAGKYRMRYLRGEEVLAEGLFELTQ